MTPPLKKKICKGYCKCPDCHVLEERFGNIPIKKKKSGGKSFEERVMEEFDKKYLRSTNDRREFAKLANENRYMTINDYANSIKSFIKEALQDYGKEIEKRLPKKKSALIKSEYPELGKLKIDMSDFNRSIGFNECLNQVITILKEMKKV